MTAIQEKLGKPYQGLTGCIDDAAAAAYLNQPDVQAAIHVKTDLPWSWVVCGGPLQYSENWGSLLPNYKDTLVPSDISVLIYNGDVDGCIPYIGNEWWTSGLGVPVKAPWHPWNTNQQVSGYATAYENNFTFVTVKGAGHMVPQYAPPQALDMFTRFVRNEDF
jgi:serine carboxypeptidase-like clade 1